jgi:hypothetical protein
MEAYRSWSGPARTMAVAIDGAVSAHSPAMPQHLPKQTPICATSIASKSWYCSVP